MTTTNMILPNPIKLLGIDMTETWKSIEEAPDYEVSDWGRVRRCKPDSFGRFCGKILAMPLGTTGYHHLNLHVNRKQYLRKVHRLVCRAFHGPAPEGMNEVRHLNGIPTDNRAENLAWGTPSENRQDTWDHGRERDTLPALRNQCFVSAVWAAEGSLVKIAARFGVNRGTVKKIKQGRAALSAGY